MRKISLLWWAFTTLLKSSFGKKQVITERDADEMIARKFNFLGSSRRPHKGMSMYGKDPLTGEVYQVPIIDDGDQLRGFFNPAHSVTWAINKKSATAKFEKYG